MTLPAFDTLAYADKLKAAGIAPDQAEAHARALAQAFAAALTTKRDLDDLRQAIQRDLAEVETRLETRINEVETRLETRINEVEARLEGRIDQLDTRIDTKISESKADLLKWLIGLLFLQAGFIVALIRLL